MIFLLTASKLKCFIPSALLAILKSNGAEAFLLTFDKDSETPELLWDTSTRTELRQSLTGLMDKIFDSDNHRIATEHRFSLPAGYKLIYSLAKHELCIGDVFVELYLKNPSFELRDPSVFLEALLFRWSQEMELFTGMRIVGNSVHADSKDLVIAKKDVTEMVTDAILCTCKLRPFLCLKLVPWGYTKAIINFILKAKSMELLGVPLLSPIRLLHLLSSDLTNIEEIISIVDSDGTHGVVDSIMKAIDGESLHPEAALMIETLKTLFQTALGDVEKNQSIIQPTKSGEHIQNIAYEIAMAPSPAPGSEPVSKLKKMSADHPLAMMLNETPPVPKKKATRAVRPNEKVNTRRSVQPTVRSSVTTAPNVPQQKISSEFRTVHHPSTNPNLRKPIQHEATQRMTPKANQILPHTSQLQPRARTTQSSSSLRKTTPSTYQVPSRHVRPQGISNDPLSSQPIQTHSRRQQRTTQSNFNAGLVQVSSRQIHSQGNPNGAQPSPSAQQYSQQRPVQSNLNASLGQIAGPQGQYSQGISNANLGQQSALAYSQQRPVQSNLNASLGQVAGPQGQYSQGISNANGVQPSTLAQQYSQQRPVQSNLNASLGQVAGPQGQYSQGISNANGVQPSALGQQYSQQRPVQSNLNASLGQVAGPQGQYSHGFSDGVQPSPSAQQYSQMPVQSNLNVNLPQMSQLPSSVSSAQPVMTEVANPTISPSLSHQTQMILPPYAMAGKANDVRSTVDPEILADERISTVAGAPNSATGRSALLDSALKCRLPQFLLLSVLESQSQSQVKDNDAVKLHTLALLHLLLKDPGYGMKFELILTSIPSWKKYKIQDQSQC